MPCDSTWMCIYFNELAIFYYFCITFRLLIIHWKRNGKKRMIKLKIFTLTHRAKRWAKRNPWPSIIYFRESVNVYYCIRLLDACFKDFYKKRHLHNEWCFHWDEKWKMAVENLFLFKIMANKCNFVIKFCSYRIFILSENGN